MATTRSMSEDEQDGERCLKQCSTPGWMAQAKNGDHLWCRSSSSGDMCYVTDSKCVGRGPRLKCSSCKIIVHSDCIQILEEKMKVLCRSTFQDAEMGFNRENTVICHHWIARRAPKGRCKGCAKNFGGKVASLLNETVAMSCSWCKQVCHNKESCFNLKKMSEENCCLGEHKNLIVPPTWIVKLPCQETENSKQVFAVKPIPSSSSKPLLVFINPKSGGNQGSKLLRTFQWLLNPRQVFDLTEGGPGVGLELYKRVPNLRILACGGDGTVGWILSVLDELKLSTCPPIAVLPLGTGNDLARALGWGGGYTDEPLTKILMNIEQGEIVKLDRWILKVNPNPSAEMSINEDGRKTLPLNVVNNYFSMGVDARIALDFHEAREARPGKFNSRFRNKMFYGQAGGKDLIQRKWKDLCNYVTLECDGQDMTPKLREMKVHSILFLNICSYGGGTRPWGNAGSQFRTPEMDDAMIEVIGLTTYQLPLLQAGGHGSPIAQCKRAKLVTSCTIPVQVDGEPCRLMPSIIEIDLLNTVNMIAKTKRHGSSMKKEHVEKISLSVKFLPIQKYESEHHRKEALVNQAICLESVSVSFDTELSEIRPQITRLLDEADLRKLEEKAKSQDVAKENDNITKVDEVKEDGKDSAQKNNKDDAVKENGKDIAQENDKNAAKDNGKDVSKQNGTSEKVTCWWFLDSCSGDKFFRIDQAQEHLYYVNDICDQELYIAEQRESTDDATNDVTKAEPDGDDVSRVSTSSSSRNSQGSGDYRELVEHNQPVMPRAEDEMDINDMDLITAAKMGHLNQVAKLHNEGHSLEEKDHEGRTALHHAAFIGNVDVVRYLAAYAPISILDSQDGIMFHTALHRAATRLDRVVCSILVSAGASLDIKDKEGHTAQELAEKLGDKVLAKYLASVAEPLVL